jgi:hypothetical protein
VVEVVVEWLRQVLVVEVVEVVEVVGVVEVHQQLGHLP